MKKIKIAQIGLNTNSHSNDIFHCLKKQSDLFEIVGYVLPENEKERLPQRAAQLEGFLELTLEEVLEADIIVHVRDIANPETKEQRRDVI